eukprot:7951895-Karenia_brevis.AAC.1
MQTNAWFEDSRQIHVDARQVHLQSNEEAFTVCGASCGSRRGAQHTAPEAAAHAAAQSARADHAEAGARQAHQHAALALETMQEKAAAETEAAIADANQRWQINMMNFIQNQQEDNKAQGAAMQHQTHQ